MNERRYRDKLKVVKVIESCTTQDQLYVAHNVVYAYNLLYNTCSNLLEYAYYNKMVKLTKER